MKVSDFKLLATLPEEYEYEILGHYKDPHLVIIGYKGREIIGRWIMLDGLRPIIFQGSVDGENVNE